MKKTDITVLQKYAISRGGKLLSTEYSNSHAALLWSCLENHKWEARWCNVNTLHSWCPTCSKLAKPDIGELQNYAAAKKGKLISNKYVNTRSNLVWECSKKHQWEATWSCVKYLNTWCPKCAKVSKPSLTEVQNYAIEKKGKLVSEQYVNKRKKLIWQCEKEHQWQATWENVHNNN